jgi:hypothetical protein
MNMHCEFLDPEQLSFGDTSLKLNANTKSALFRSSPNLAQRIVVYMRPMLGTEKVQGKSGAQTPTHEVTVRCQTPASAEVSKEV